MGSGRIDINLGDGMKKKILIVDDEPGIVRLLSIRLKAKGYEVLVAHDGVEGI